MVKEEPFTYKGKRIKDMTREEYDEALAASADIKNCPIQGYISLFGGKWGIRVLFELSRLQTARFGQLKAAIPQITNTMLAATLRDFVEAGVVERTSYNEVPPRVEYTITERGRSLGPVFYEMARWCDGLED